MSDKITISELALTLLSGLKEWRDKIIEVTEITEASTEQEDELLILFMFCNTKAINDVLSDNASSKKILNKFHEAIYSILIEKGLSHDAFNQFQKKLTERYAIYYECFNSDNSESNLYLFNETFVKNFLTQNKSKNSFTVAKIGTAINEYLTGRATFIKTVQNKYTIES